MFRLDAVRNLFRFSSKSQERKTKAGLSFDTIGRWQPTTGTGDLRDDSFRRKTWGIHYVMGGTGALVNGLVRKFDELGGTLICEAEVAKIDTVEGLFKAKATGVTLIDGRSFTADVVCSNADYAHTYRNLINPQHRRKHTDSAIKRKQYSMSLLVVYFGFKELENPLDLKHHNIILGPRYEELLGDIFDRKVLADDFSQYLHIPTLTDPSMAPPGHQRHTLIPVESKGDIDWAVEGPRFRTRFSSF